MKKIIIAATLMLCALAMNAQNQTVNGDLTVKGSTFIGQNISNKWGEGERLYLGGTDYSNDPVWIGKYTSQKEYTDLRVNVRDELHSQDHFIVGTTHWSTKQWHDVFVVGMSGIVTIPQANSKLDVNGTIRAKEVKIEATGWADFVFAPEYNLPSLSDVKKHIEEKQHLPNIPSEAEVKENGVDVGEMQIKLLQKIEELTLYVIELKEENVALTKRIDHLEK